MTETTHVKLNSPAQVLPVIPLLLGFAPSPGDVVTLGLGPRGRVIVSARMDGADVARYPAEVSDTYANMAVHGVTSLFLVGYGEGTVVTPSMDAARKAADGLLPLADAVRVDGNRYWPYTCQDIECCPAEGRQFEPENEATTTLRVNAEMSARSSRQELADSIAPVEQTAQARQAWHRAEQQPPTVNEGRQLVQDALAAAREGRQLSDDAVARLGVAMRALPVRDDAWSRMAPEQAEEHSALWADVVRRTPDAAVAAPASLLAFTAWQKGAGAEANVALDRALRADPGYTMAQLVGQAVSALLPPDMAVLPMTPEEVAASYEPLADYDAEIGA